MFRYARHPRILRALSLTQQTSQVAIRNSTLEETQGKALIDKALKQKIQFFVYSSVDQRGDASYNTATRVPHFIHKYNIEHHLVEKSKDTDIK